MISYNVCTHISATWCLWQLLNVLELLAFRSEWMYYNDDNNTILLVHYGYHYTIFCVFFLFLCITCTGKGYIQYIDQQQNCVCLFPCNTQYTFYILTPQVFFVFQEFFFCVMFGARLYSRASQSSASVKWRHIVLIEGFFNTMYLYILFHYKWE